MTTRHDPQSRPAFLFLILPVLTILRFLTMTPCAVAAGPLSADKTPVTDGHVVHDLGLLQNHVTNFGLIGSRPGVPTPFEHQPSARWPGAGGVDHLWAAGLWVGGTVLGESLVSTGQYFNEIMASSAPVDTIYPTWAGAPGGARFPWPGADDDGDGLEDEDPLDGCDNDGDGLVDEDYAAVGDQSFVCLMSDTTLQAVSLFPDHTPLNLEVRQRSFQWADPHLSGAIGYEYTVRNIGVVAITGIRPGLFSDMDVGSASDDLVGHFDGLYRIRDGSFAPVRAVYSYDGAAAPVGGFAGWVACGFETDAASGFGGDELAVPTVQIYSGNEAYENGGDPTNDTERLADLRADTWDAVPPTHLTADYRVLMGFPETGRLEPGESFTLRLALVAGADLDEMLATAGEMVSLAYGRAFDRDGDPANGEEFRVHWLGADDGPVAAAHGRLAAVRQGGAVMLEFSTNATTGLARSVVRRPGPGVPERRWIGLDASGRIRDEEPVGWPRTYELLGTAARGGDLVLAGITLDGPVVAAPVLRAYPTPFNPRVRLGFALTRPQAVDLRIHDVRGRVVRHVIRGETLTGGVVRDWDGADDAGLPLPSGTYFARLSSPDGGDVHKLVLVR